MRANSVGFAVALVLTAGPLLQAQRSTAPAASTRSGSSEPVNGRFELTVDSIMRGPGLVGYPPTGLRWAADSQKLYFDWRKPADDKASTYVVDRTGGTPRKLSDEEAKNIPPQPAAAGTRRAVACSL